MKKLLTIVAIAGIAGGCNLDGDTMDDWDIDLSGDVSQNEFQERWYESGYWELWDRNNDGVITEEEWNQGLDEYYERFDKDEYNFTRFDLDEDKGLNEDELPDGIFTIWDKDGDGEIDEAEFREREFSPTER